MGFCHIIIKVAAVSGDQKNKIYGELAEWSKAHDWKSCNRDERFQGSNP